MATLTDEEIEFKSQFKGRGYATGTRTEKRLKAERRAAMTDRQLSRGGRARNAQMNFRTTPAMKALATMLAAKLGMGIAETIELAISELASRHGVNDVDA